MIIGGNGGKSMKNRHHRIGSSGLIKGVISEQISHAKLTQQSSHQSKRFINFDSEVNNNLRSLVDFKDLRRLTLSGINLPQQNFMSRQVVNSNVGTVPAADFIFEDPYINL